MKVERRITKEEFEKRYAEKSNLSLEKLHKLGLKARPCNCGSCNCRGWQMISNESWELWKKIHGGDKNGKQRGNNKKK